MLPILRDLPGSADERLLVGSGTADDAAVYRLTDDLALVLTIDFFTPIVDDPFQFGGIAAANALSDVYAMGGKPLAAMNVLAFPLQHLGVDVLREILRGGAEMAARAGIPIVGGHSIDDSEPKYGLSVTGVVHPDELVSNAGARPGDVLVLTKPLGVGAIVTARKRGSGDEAMLARAVETMTTLNDAASAAARAAGASAMTDVTGFGLLGHLHSLGLASGVAARVDAGVVPAIEGVIELLEGEQAVSGGSARNRDYAETFTSFAAGRAGVLSPARVRRDDLRWPARRRGARACRCGAGRRGGRPHRWRTGHDRRDLGLPTWSGPGPVARPVFKTGGRGTPALEGSTPSPLLDTGGTVFATLPSQLRCGCTYRPIVPVLTICLLAFTRACKVPLGKTRDRMVGWYGRVCGCIRRQCGVAGDRSGRQASQACNDEGCPACVASTASRYGGAAHCCGRTLHCRGSVTLAEPLGRGGACWYVRNLRSRGGSAACLRQTGDFLRMFRG